jgi:hypothetical protein
MFDIILKIPSIELKLVNYQARSVLSMLTVAVKNWHPQYIEGKIALATAMKLINKLESKRDKEKTKITIKVNEALALYLTLEYVTDCFDLHILEQATYSQIHQQLYNRLLQLPEPFRTDLLPIKHDLANAIST